MRRLVAVMLFLTLVNDGDATALYSKPAPLGFSATGFGPFDWVQPLLFTGLPIGVRLFDVVTFVLLVVASLKKSGKTSRVQPMRNALLLAAGTTLVAFLYGISTGGNARYASWQCYLLLSAVLFAFTVSALFVTPEHYELLAKTVIAAGIYRAVICWWFYFAYVRGHARADGYITTHHDSVVWVISIFTLLVHALTKQRRATSVRAALLAVLFLGAMQWNTRRLAWVSLVMALTTAFFLLPRSGARARLTRALLKVGPVLAIYLAVGWGRPERIFLPLRSLSSVESQEDNSTKARIAENLGLIATVRKAGAMMGTGWGHEYIELTTTYSLRGSGFELAAYVPHNGILGLLAYTGVLGFAGFWLAFPTAMFLNARLAKVGKTQQVRNIGFVCSTAMVVCGNQFYGDMGWFSLPTMYLLATTYAAAMRLPVFAGVWLPSRTPAASPHR